MHAWMYSVVASCNWKLTSSAIAYFMELTISSKTKVQPGERESANRHAAKSAQTRARLLESAEKIFARDGFESAKLEEIAAGAGYTRGAFYATFDSKEDLFIELLAEEVEKRISRAREATGMRAKQALPKRELYKALRQNYIRTLRNPTWNILFIEYKLFILRHPDFRKKVIEMQAKAFATMASGLEEIFADAGVSPAARPLAAGMALAALANTLGLDLAVNNALSEKEVNGMLSVFFDAVCGHCRPMR
jgi:AcrR family transcriptional regulator